MLLGHSKTVTHISSGMAAGVGHAHFVGRWEMQHRHAHFVGHGGWHFTCLRSPEELEQKLLNFAHHYEFEESGLKIHDLKKLIIELDLSDFVCLEYDVTDDRKKELYKSHTSAISSIVFSYDGNLMALGSHD